MKVEDPEQALTEAVCSRVREQLAGADAELAEAFARQFYRWVAPEDVAERDPLDLYGLALGHFNFARERPPGTTKVRVYNPRFEEHGWQSTHTAVEIVTDDMPFLIDSVSMELNRRGCGRPPDHPPRALGAPRRRGAAGRDPARPARRRRRARSASPSSTPRWRGRRTRAGCASWSGTSSA